MVSESLHASDDEKNNDVIDLPCDMLECGCGYLYDNISCMRLHVSSRACWYSWTEVGEDDLLKF